MKIQEITEDDLYELAVWYRLSGKVDRRDISYELAQQIGSDTTGYGINGRKI